MRISDPQLRGHLAERGVDLRPGAKLSEWTSLGIGGTTDMLRITKHASIPDLLGLLEASRVPHRFLGGGSNLFVDDGELPWVVLQLVPPEPDVVLEGNLAHIDAAADLGRTVTFCAKHDLGGMEGLIGVPGTVGGALRMNSNQAFHAAEVVLSAKGDGAAQVSRGMEGLIGVPGTVGGALRMNAGNSNQ